jgi:hypothetical protein
VFESINGFPGHHRIPQDDTDDGRRLLRGGPPLSTAIQLVALPQPTPIPSHAALCMRGKLVQEGASHVCRGKWAEKRDHFAGRDLAWKFKFSIMLPAAVPLPADGQYDGYFHMPTEQGSATYLVKYKDTSNLAFTPNSCSGWNIKGRGQNAFGTYRVTGTVTADMELELFRFFDHLMDCGGGGWDHRGQQQPPRPPIVTAPAPAPFPQEPTFTSSATAGAGAGSSSVDDPTTVDDEDKVGWRGA